MEASSLYPDGFHPILQRLAKSGLQRVTGRRRMESAPVKYCFIDFELSGFLNPNGESFTTGRQGQDLEVPELSDLEIFAPTPVDIFTLGNVYKKTFLNVCNQHRFVKTCLISIARLGLQQLRVPATSGRRNDADGSQSATNRCRGICKVQATCIA